jgi:hypothetical protein
MEGGFRLYSKRGGVTDDRIHASTDALCVKHNVPA